MSDVIFYTKVEGDQLVAYFKQGKHIHKMSSLHMAIAREDEYLNIWKNALLSMIDLMAAARGATLGKIKVITGEEAIRQQKAEGL